METEEIKKICLWVFDANPVLVPQENLNKIYVFFHNCFGVSVRELKTCKAPHLIKT